MAYSRARAQRGEELDDNGTKVPAQLTLDKVSPATLLLEKRRQMIEVQQALEAQKDEYSRKESMFLRREQQLRKKDLQLQENLCQFNKFLKDKSDKRQQYLKKADDERRQKLVKEKEIAKARKELRDALTEFAQLEMDWKNSNKYEKYLESVKKYDDTEIEFTLRRYEVLNEARKNLIKKEETSSRELEKLRGVITDFIKEQNTKCLDLNNEKQRLQRTLEEAGNKVQEFETSVARIVRQKAENKRIISETLTTSQNLYERAKTYLRNVHHFQDMNIDEAAQAKDASKQNTKLATEKPAEEDAGAKKIFPAKTPKQEEQGLSLDAKIQLGLMQLEIVARYVEDAKCIANVTQHRKFGHL